MASSNRDINCRNGIETQGNLFTSDSVLSQTDVTVLRTSIDTSMDGENNTKSFESLTSICLDSEPLTFSSGSENGYLASLSSHSGSDTSEMSDALFEAELIKFLQSFGVDESDPTINTVDDDELVQLGESKNVNCIQNTSEDDVGDFLKSMQMMEVKSNDSQSDKTEETGSSWFGLGSLGGMMKGVVNESVHGMQNLGYGMKRMLSSEGKIQESISENLIDFSTDEGNSTAQNSYLNQSNGNLNFTTNQSEEGNTQEANVDDNGTNQSNTKSGYMEDFKAFSDAMTSFFNKNVVNLHPPGEVIPDMKSGMTEEEREEENETVEHESMRDVDNMNESQMLHSADISPTKTTTTQESLIDSVLNDLADPVTSIRHLYRTSEDNDEQTHCELEVADVLAYVNKASSSAKDVLEAYQIWLPIRKETIKKLKQIAKAMDESGRDTKFLDTIGIGSGLAGSAIALTGLLLAPVTGGIATGLIVKGGLMAGVGGVTSAGAAIGGTLTMKEKLKEVEKCIASDKEKTEVLFEKLRNHTSVINQAQESIENLRKGILSLVAQGIRFGAKTRKLLCIGMSVIKHNQKSVGTVLKRLGLPGVKAINKKVAAFNFAKAGAPTMIGVKAVKAMRVGHSLVPYLFMPTAVWESIELYSTVSSLLSGESVPEAAEVKNLVVSLEAEIQEITNELKELGILLYACAEDIQGETLQMVPVTTENVDEDKVSEVNNNTSDEDNSVPLEMTVNSILMSD